MPWWGFYQVKGCSAVWGFVHAHSGGGRLKRFDGARLIPVKRGRFPKLFERGRGFLLNRSKDVVYRGAAAASISPMAQDRPGRLQ